MILEVSVYIAQLELSKATRIQDLISCLARNAANHTPSTSNLWYVCVSPMSLINSYLVLNTQSYASR